jgi:hypothetical protein
MLVDVLQFDGEVALLAQRKLMRKLAIVEQMVREFSNVDVAVALVTENENLAVVDIMVPLVDIGLGTV